MSIAEPVGQTFGRPDILDRNGNLLATDVAASSLYADPAVVLDLDEAAERLAMALPDLDPSEIRRSLADRTKRFVWLKRGLTPLEAQSVHDEGLPGVGFRREQKRVYPGEEVVGHILGHVNVDNRGQSGIERWIDETLTIESLAAAGPNRLDPVRLSIDIGVQQAVSGELATAMERYKAAAASGLVMDVMTGEVIAAVSLPAVNPNRPATLVDKDRADRLHFGAFELGSIFKTLTVAQALEDGSATLDTLVDVAEPIEIGRYRIRDHHPTAAQLTVRDVFLHSSNVGAGRLALAAGADRQRSFLARLGLIDPVRTEVGLVRPPLVPGNWGPIETVTIGYGHGLAVAPVQFAAAAASLVNGGWRVTPTFIRKQRNTGPPERVLASATSDAQREIWRLNVTAAHGTGRRADVAGMRVGGKTGTAEMPGRGGYLSKSVIASFVGALPMDEPRYLTLVSLFEPKATPETKGAITAAYNAAPTTARVVARIAPILGVLPRRLAAPRADDNAAVQR
ncbi:MAG TPA: penicillin-binding protein 2 [Hyphomicrobiaceae bacterium]|nr:penicillin-binding protein 2 [Hyphomicrobiaceae bacterium]